MVKSYCVKQKKQTECVEPSGYKQAKNGRLMFFCTCAECGIKKTKFVKNKETNGALTSWGQFTWRGVDERYCKRFIQSWTSWCSKGC